MEELVRSGGNEEEKRWMRGVCEEGKGGELGGDLREMSRKDMRSSENFHGLRV